MSALRSYTYERFTPPSGLEIISMAYTAFDLADWTIELVDTATDSTLPQWITDALAAVAGMRVTPMVWRWRSGLGVDGWVAMIVEGKRRATYAIEVTGEEITPWADAWMAHSVIGAKVAVAQLVCEAASA